MRSDWHTQLLRHPRLLSAAKRAAKGGAQILGVLEQYHLTERLDPAELAHQQRVLLAGLAAHSARESPYFAQRLRAAGLTAAELGEPGGLARLPVMTRRELADAPESLFCRSIPPEHGRIGQTSTSGSTGEPVTLRRTELCDLHWSAHTIREHLWHERDSSAPLAAIRANVTAIKHYPNWGYPCDRVLRSGAALGLPASHPLGELLERLLEFHPGYLLVLPGVLEGIIGLLDQSGRRLEGLRGIRTLSETVSLRLRTETRRVTGLEIHDCYSSQEGGVMATQCPEVGNYHVAETVILEIVNAAGHACPPGEVGRVLLTDLINFATPVIRYEIGDYAEAGTTCPCGRGMPVIRRFLGRERNLVMFPDGSRHWPVVGFQVWGEAYPIRQFQFVQWDRHTIEARLSATGHPAPAQEARLTELIQAALGHPFELRYVWHEGPLPRGPAGKFEEFISHAR